MNTKDRSPPIVWDEVSDVPPSMYEPRTTPRPWRAKPVPRAVRTAFLCAADGTVVSPRVEQMDDAALIVRAVNSFDAMRDALMMMDADAIAARVRAMALDPSARCEQYAMLLGEIGTAARAALALADQETTP